MGGGILWRCVRTLSAVPNLEYKDRLSVLYLLPETFRYLACPRDQRLGDAPPPALGQAGRKGLRHRAAELQRRTVSAFVLHLGVERARRPPSAAPLPSSTCLTPGNGVSSH